MEGGELLILTWEDGSTTRLTARRLRAGCSCAECRDPSGARATQEVLAGEEEIRIADVQMVGAYALNFTFQPDGHHTGIFSFELLRRLGERE